MNQASFDPEAKIILYLQQQLKLKYQLRQKPTCKFGTK